jgi:hypothetical protein
LEFAKLTLQFMKLIPFVLLPRYFERESWLGVSSLLYFIGYVMNSFKDLE